MRTTGVNANSRAQGDRALTRVSFLEPAAGLGAGADSSFFGADSFLGAGFDSSFLGSGACFLSSFLGAGASSFFSSFLGSSLGCSSFLGSSFGAESAFSAPVDESSGQILNEIIYE